ncbi:MAG: pyridoxal phosphate-dependent aminotransferase [Saccharofermentanales bacterium]
MISDVMKASLEKSSMIRRMFEEGNRLRAIYGAENVFDFSLGNPDLEPPASVLEAIREVALSTEPGLHKYMSNAGYLSTRSAVARFLGEDSGLAVPPDNIVMTVGAAGALNVTLKVLLDPKDEVLVIAPFFVEYLSYIRNHNGVPVIVKCRPDTFELDIDAIRSAIRPVTKAVIINSPNNPCGVIYSEESLRELNDMLLSLDHTVYVISDEPYREIVFDGAAVPSTMKIMKNLIMCYSWSKALALPGDRIGFLAASPDCEDLKDLIAAAISANRSLGFVNAPAMMQKVIERSIGAKVDVASYQQRCDALYDIISEAGIECLKPKGALYLFPKSPIADDYAFISIAAKHNILAVPGAAFGMPGYFRLTFCVDINTILNSRNAFAETMQDCRSLHT